jgi:hypothetical protein
LDGHFEAARDFAKVFEGPVLFRAAGKRMDRREIFKRRLGHGNAGNSASRNRQGREEGERKMADGVAKFGSICPIPGGDGMERRKLRDGRALDHAQQLDSGVEDGSGAIGEADERQGHARRPDLGVFSARGFELRQGQDHVADGAGANQKSAVQVYFNPYSLRALSRRTM